MRCSASQLVPCSPKYVLQALGYPPQSLLLLRIEVRGQGHSDISEAAEEAQGQARDELLQASAALTSRKL